MKEFSLLFFSLIFFFFVFFFIFFCLEIHICSSQFLAQRVGEFVIAIIVIRLLIMSCWIMIYITRHFKSSTIIFLSFQIFTIFGKLEREREGDRKRERERENDNFLADFFFSYDYKMFLKY